MYELCTYSTQPTVQFVRPHLAGYVSCGSVSVCVFVCVECMFVCLSVCLLRLHAPTRFLSLSLLLFPSVHVNHM